MSTQCVCKSWNRGYGFAEAETGEVVYVHGAEIPGMRLKSGGVINCDLVPVEGHDGRVKGTNVSGPGLVPKEEKRTSEELTEERTEWARFKEEKIAVEGAGPPKPKRQKGGGRVAGGGKGVKGAKGPVGETRIDPADGQSYAKADFKACYGGFKEWDAAAPRPAPTAGRGRGRGAGSSQPEKRIDPADGRAYTKDNFFSCYGGYSEWSKASPASRGGKGKGKGRGGGRGVRR